jgi:hypothetical protein
MIKRIDHRSGHASRAGLFAAGGHDITGAF